jgi:hypothetical protein
LPINGRPGRATGCQAVVPTAAVDTWYVQPGGQPSVSWLMRSAVPFATSMDGAVDRLG